MDGHHGLRQLARRRIEREGLLGHGATGRQNEKQSETRKSEPMAGERERTAEGHGMLDFGLSVAGRHFARGSMAKKAQSRAAGGIRFDAGSMRARADAGRCSGAVARNLEIFPAII